MTTLRELLNKKGGDVHFARPDDTVLDAIQQMADRNIGALMVLDGDKPVGIFTERLYAREVFLKGRGSPNTKISEVMERQVCYADLSQSVDECMAVMTDKKVRHLPVMDGGKLVGIVSIGDLVKNKIADQEFAIDQLEQYIRTS
ncbi:MAG: CBS domain-containing protein [Rhodospirillales bacterium]|nr:CBS domain-containing protein [Rhodospirillales bacterium]